MEHEAPARFVLVHRQNTPVHRSRPPVIVLHGRDRDLHATADLEAVLAGDRTTIAIQGPRAQTLAETVVGYSWYLEPPGGPIELSTLGDALAQLEQGLLRLLDGGGSVPVTIVGEGQGGTMALLLASIWPELVTRAVAIGGSFPQLPPEVGLPSGAMTGVRIVLLSGDPNGGRVDDAAAARLRDRGAAVETVDLGQTGAGRAAWVSAWLADTDP
jgi:pimeloyl-ACP methyl ester carboxylesterase